MKNNDIVIDLSKLAKYVLKRIWIPIILGLIGFGYRYWTTSYRMPNTYTASGTMYVYNGNPNLINYQYASATDLDSAVKLIDTYLIVVRSKKVMDVVAERLSREYPGIDTAFISSSLGMASVNDTGVVRVISVTDDPRLSYDICNAVLDVAPSEIIRVVGAGSVEVIDYATLPERPDDRRPKRRGLVGAFTGFFFGLVLIFVLFILNRRITEEKDLTDNYSPPVLSTVHRRRENSDNAGSFLLTKDSPMGQMESYARLRMNLLYMMVGSKSNVVIMTSAVSGEGKSTIAANLAVSCSLSGKKVLLVDSDLRRGCQRDIFSYEKVREGLSETLVGSIKWQDAVIRNITEGLDLLPSGQFPPNPAELLGTEKMKTVLSEMSAAYDLVVLDMPPVNIVTDPLILSSCAAGCVFVVRQNYSDQRDIKKALTAASLTEMNVLGFVLYGEKLDQTEYYRRKHYRRYYKGKYGKEGYPDYSSPRPAAGKTTRKTTKTKSKKKT